MGSVLPCPAAAPTTPSAPDPSLTPTRGHRSERGASHRPSAAAGSIGAADGAADAARGSGQTRCGPDVVFPWPMDVVKYRRLRAATNEPVPEDTGPACCGVCGERLDSKAELHTHALGHKKHRHFPCTVCGHASKRENGYAKHLRAHGARLRYLCPHCDATTHCNGHSLQAHVKSAHPGLCTFVCPHPGCSYTIDSVTAAAGHAAKSHAKAAAECEGQSSAQAALFFCPLCRVVSTDAPALARHVATAHSSYDGTERHRAAEWRTPGRPWPKRPPRRNAPSPPARPPLAATTGASVRAPARASGHAPSAGAGAAAAAPAANPARPSPSSRVFECGRAHCDFVARSWEELWFHQAVEHGVDGNTPPPTTPGAAAGERAEPMTPTGALLHCSQCSFTTRYKKAMTTHERAHSDVRPFPCPLCPYRAKYEGFLSLHARRYHQGATPRKRTEPSGGREGASPGRSGASASTPDAGSAGGAVLLSSAKRARSAECEGESSSEARSDSSESESGEEEPALPEYHLDKHYFLDTRGPAPMFECTMCGYKSLKEGWVVRHLRTAHGAERGPAPSAIHRCPLCGESLPTALRLRSHLSLEHPEVVT